MNREYTVIVDSMADFKIGFSDPDLVIVETPVSIGDQDFTHATPEEFYRQQRLVFEANASKKERDRTRIFTSTPNPGRIQEEMEKILDSGKDAIYVATASSLTAAYSSGISAVTTLQDESCGRLSNRAIVIDGLSMSALTSILVKAAMERCETTDQFLSFVMDRRNDTEHLFAVSEWEAFRNSGRISEGTLIIAKMTGYKPLMRFDFGTHGERYAFCEKKHRWFKTLMEYSAQKMLDTIDPEFPTCTIIHADNYEGAGMLFDAIKRIAPDIEVEFDPDDGRMGPATGVHLGYSAVGLGFIRKKGIYVYAEHHREMQNPIESIFEASDADD